MFIVNIYYIPSYEYRVLWGLNLAIGENDHNLVRLTNVIDNSS